MKKNNGLMIAGIIIGVILFCVLIIALSVGGTYNNLVKLRNDAENKWAYVQTAYQKRADLIPNLVAVVKEYSDYEGEVLTEVTKARSSWGEASTPEEQQAAAGAMDSALSRLLVVMENYPELKANENYLSLQDELTSTENEIKIERNRYNDAVTKLNNKVEMFPSNIVARMYAFKTMVRFEAQAGAENAPDVKTLFE